jgi:hypothetical protein
MERKVTSPAYDLAVAVTMIEEARDRILSALTADTDKWNRKKWMVLLNLESALEEVREFYRIAGGK